MSKRKPIYNFPKTTLSPLVSYPDIPPPTIWRAQPLSKYCDYIIKLKNKNSEEQYLHEFTIQDCKFARKMADLCDEEIRLWSLHIDMHDATDFFNEDWRVYRKEMRIVRWAWTHDGETDLLIDMNNWLGDNVIGKIEAGKIYMNGKIIFHNNVSKIIAVNPPKEIEERVDSFIHLRKNLIKRCEHKHCQRVFAKYKSFTD